MPSKNRPDCPNKAPISSAIHFLRSSNCVAALLLSSTGAAPASRRAESHRRWRQRFIRRWPDRLGSTFHILGLSESWSRVSPASCQHVCRWPPSSKVSPGGSSLTPMVLFQGSSPKLRRPNGYMEPPISRACRGIRGKRRISRCRCARADQRCLVGRDHRASLIISR